MRQHELIEILDRVHAVRVLVLGDVMLDRFVLDRFVYGSVARVSPEAPIPVLEVTRSVDSAGGAANVARNIAAIGASATLIGVIGSDSDAAKLKEQLASSPTIDAQLIVDFERPTTVKTRYVADGQQMLRADRESCAQVNEEIAARLLARFEDAVPHADIVVLSDYAKGVLCERVIKAAIHAARAAHKPVIVDPKAKDLRKYAGATVLTPNRMELQAACGFECATDEAVEAAADALLDSDICTAVVVTRGKDGMSVMSKGEAAVHLRTLARQVFDVSGAGDTAVAALSSGLAAGAHIVSASSLANLAAGIVVAKLGTAVVTVSELIEQLTPLNARVGDSKIFTLQSVLQLMRTWREQGLSIAFTNGCFDLLHPGHVSLLDQAKRSADRLIVGLNADESIRRLKGPDRPIQYEIARATVLSSLKFVDAVVIFSEDTPIDLIHALEPDVLVKGADYALEEVVGADFVIRRGGSVLLADLVEGHSTTGMMRRVVAPRTL
jgi:D-beta-D-heptose 7-phosphate kinase/D-beta-D-heptose 1-phosphate adenosyltransferase